MSLADQLLGLFQGWTTEPITKSRIRLHSEDVTFTADFEEANSLACSINEVSFRVSDATWSFTQVKAIAQTICDQWDFLLEQLAIIESDQLNDTIQVRSGIPAETLGSYQYYEVLVEPTGDISLKRFECATAEKSRVCKTMHFTNETLARLCERTETLLLKELMV